MTQPVNSSARPRPEPVDGPRPEPAEGLSVISVPDSLLILLLLLLAFVPRVVALDTYVATDEAKWILRSAHFLTSLRSGDYSAAASQIATPEVDVLAPAVTTMWGGAAGLLAKYGADSPPVSLDAWLAALPYGHSEQMPLDFYPWLRFPTVLVTSLFVPAFYVLLRRLLDNQAIAATAAALLALDPFFINHSRVIHHDALVMVFSTLSLLAVMLYLRHFQRRWLVASGVTLGLALLTKPTALLLVPFVGLMFVWRIHQSRRWSLLGWGLLWGGLGLLTFVALWPALWADPLGTVARLTATSATGAAGSNDQTLIPALIPGRLPELGFLFYPVNFLFRWGILPTLGLILAIFAWRQPAVDAAAQVKSALGWFLLYSLLLLLVLTPLATRDIRYYLLAWPLLLAVAAFGLLHLRRWFKPVTVAGLALLLLLPYYPYYISYLNPLALGPILAPRLVKLGGGAGLDQAGRFLNAQPNIEQKTAASYLLESFKPYFAGQSTDHKSSDYADYTVNYIRQLQNEYPSAEHLVYFSARPPAHTVRLNGVDYATIYLEPEPKPVKDVSFDDITLAAQTLDARYAQPGQSHWLTLLWRLPPETMSPEVRLEGRDAAGQVWLTGAGPLLWPEGPSPIEGRYRLDFPADMPRGQYEVWLTVGDSQEWQRVTEVAVHQLNPPASIPQPLAATFDHWLTLRGFDLSDRQPRPGDTLTVTLYWQAEEQRPLAYTNFVHLVDAAGNAVAQADVTPGGGAAPTDTWVPGEWLTDAVSLTLPADLPPDEYRLLVGWYYWETLERLPLLDDASGQNVVIIPGVTVE